MQIPIVFYGILYLWRETEQSAVGNYISPSFRVNNVENLAFHIVSMINMLKKFRFGEIFLGNNTIISLVLALTVHRAEAYILFL